MKLLLMTLKQCIKLFYKVRKNEKYSYFVGRENTPTVGTVLVGGYKSWISRRISRSREAMYHSIGSKLSFSIRKTGTPFAINLRLNKIF